MITELLCAESWVQREMKQSHCVELRTRERRDRIRRGGALPKWEGQAILAYWGMASVEVRWLASFAMVGASERVRG